jgi:hypothetical protein
MTDSLDRLAAKLAATPVSSAVDVPGRYKCFVSVTIRGHVEVEVDTGDSARSLVERCAQAFPNTGGGIDVDLEQDGISVSLSRSDGRMAMLVEFDHGSCTRCDRFETRS